jgi:hypothetical protein
MRLETSVAHTVNVECFLVVYTSIAKCIKHSTWGVLSQGRNSKELTVRETHSGTLGLMEDNVQNLTNICMSIFI